MVVKLMSRLATPALPDSPLPPALAHAKSQRADTPSSSSGCESEIQLVQ